MVKINKYKKAQMSQQEVTAIVILAIFLFLLALVFFFSQAKIFKDAVLG